MKLIDADAFKLVLRDAWLKISDTYGKNDEYCQCIDKVMMWLNDQPIYNKEGKWIHEGHDEYVNYWRCSNCKKLFGDNSRKHDPYCSHCGAKMIGVVE